MKRNTHEMVGIEFVVHPFANQRAWGVYEIVNKGGRSGIRLQFLASYKTEKEAREVAKVLEHGPARIRRGKGNPRRRGTRRRARPIRQSLRVVARGMQRRVRRAFGGRGMKLNPMSKRNYEFMARYIAGLKAAGADAQIIDALLEFAVATIRADGNPRFDAERFTLVALGGKYHRKNPALALVGANPRGGKYLGRCTEVRYLREAGAHRGRYRHPFKTRARLVAMPNGSLAIIGG